MEKGQGEKRAIEKKDEGRERERERKNVISTVDRSERRLRRGVCERSESVDRGLLS